MLNPITAASVMAAKARPISSSRSALTIQRADIGRVPDSALGPGHWETRTPPGGLTWRGLGNPLAKERNSQRAPLGQPVGAVVVS
jgi:hypothetical protein